MSTGPSPREAPLESAFEESVEELYEMAPCGYLTTSVEGRILKINRTLLDWLGYTRQELTGGKRLVDLLTFGGKIYVETHLNLLLRLKTTVDEIALDIVCKDGRVLPALINARQKRDAAGEPLLNRFTIFNASDRRMYERELLAARDLLDTTLSSIGDGVIATDSEARVTFMNPIAEQLSGWSRDAARGKPIDQILCLVGEDDGRNVENPVSHTLRAGKIVGLEGRTVLVAKDGRRFPVEDSASPMRDAAGTLVGGVLVFRDVSDRRKMEELEREQREQRREAARLESLGLMAGGIAHEFNNLLTGILGNASLLAESVSDADVSLVNEILSSGARAASITKQMLAYTGKAWARLANIDLNALIAENLAIMRASLSSRIRVEFERGPDDCLVEADTAQIQQVVFNLLINAAEAIGANAGRIVVRTGVVASSPGARSDDAARPERYVLLEVADNGAGIAEDARIRIFDPFFTTKFTGRGLGLSAVLGIVKAHHGEIDVETEPGAGSVFRVYLPSSKRVSEAALDPAPAPKPRAMGETILIVDDEEVVRKLASAALRSHGMKVVVAPNASDALAVLRGDSSIAAAVLDLIMPGMSGEEALPLMRAIRPDLPIIISSGFSEAEIARRFESFRIAGVLAKPYKVDAIVSKVAAALNE